MVEARTERPSGRPVGSRSKFSEAMVADFAADWNEHGAGVLERVRMPDPATYLRWRQCWCRRS